ncbi:MAG: DUF948 domain-containing protein [Sulfuriferula sp.]|nr:DUF948 domain-containing protein [Sulfuriferula sp.]
MTTENNKQMAGNDYVQGTYTPPVKDKPYYAQYIDKAEAGMRTVKLVVFAGMSAFVVLAIYGYYLIFQLTNDAAQMTKSMQDMTRNMQSITVSVAQMNQSTAQMADSVNRMQYATSNMDKTFTTPMNAINSFMPWGSAPVQYPQQLNNPYMQR